MVGSSPDRVITRLMATPGLPSSGALAVSTDNVQVDAPGWQNTEHLREESGKQLAYDRLRWAGVGLEGLDESTWGVGRLEQSVLS